MIINTPIKSNLYISQAIFFAANEPNYYIHTYRWSDELYMQVKYIEDDDTYLIRYIKITSSSIEPITSWDTNISVNNVTIPYFNIDKIEILNNNN